MARGTSSRSYAKAIMDGISSASKLFDKWTGGDWLDYAPEYLVTVEVARKLGALGPVLLEVSTRQTIVDGAAKGRGRHHKALDGLKRFDIVCYEKSGEQLPRAIVEVKNPYYGRSGVLEKDIDRVAKSLKRATANRMGNAEKRASLRHGFLAFYAYTRTPKPKGIDADADARVDRWISEIQTKVAKHGVRAVGMKRGIRTLDDFHAYAVVIAMTAPSARVA